jgi:hypothetical protein
MLSKGADGRITSVSFSHTEFFPTLVSLLLEHRQSTRKLKTAGCPSLYTYFEACYGESFWPHFSEKS